MTPVLLRSAVLPRRNPPIDVDVDVVRAAFGIIGVLALVIATGCRRDEMSGALSVAPLGADAVLPGDRFVPTALLSAPATIGGICSIDAVDSQPSKQETVNVETGQQVRISGWIAAPDRQPPKNFRVTLNGQTTYSASAATGERRPDVAQTLKSHVLSNAGFTLVARTDGVAPGAYTVSLAQRYDGLWHQCHSTSRILVVASPLR